MADYADPLAVYRTSGADPANLAVAAGPPKTDPNNPLSLSAAAPGYLPADQRPAQRDPDLGWQEGMSPGQIIATPDQLPVDLRNKVSQAQRDWGEMDSSYWAAHSQKPLPLVLGALGAIAAPFALSALGIGGAAAGGLGGAGAGGAGAGLSGLAGNLGAAGAGLTTGGALAPIAAGTAAGAGATISEFVVTAAAHGIPLSQIAAAASIPVSTAASILSNSGGSNVLQGSQGTDTVSPTTDVEGITVVPKPLPTPSVLPGVATAAGGLGAIGALAGAGGGDTPLPLQDNLAPIQPPSISGPLNNPPAFTPTPNTPPSLLQAIKSGDPSQIGGWIAANPLQAVQLGLLSASALSTVAGGGTPSNSASGTFHSVDLPSSFSATSPHFALAGRGTPRVMPAQDWTKYGQGPEQSFFTGVNQPAAITNLSVAKPSVVVPDRIHPKPRGYAHGGFAVRGDGDGRSDSIDAKLSDGEYVMDAETVALLGNGSNRAGADKLDQFRVNLRKDKGRGLARGEFSVHAKDPMAYAQGGR